jgi:tetratricopeptide (TPR) repeat protein
MPLTYGAGDTPDGSLDVKRRRATPRSGRGRRRSPTSRLLAKHGEAASCALLAACVIGSAMAVGAVHIPVLLLVTLLGGSALAIGLRSGVVSAAPPAPAWVAFGLALYTFLQAAPLPISVLERLAPANADVWSHALTPLGHAAPGWARLSLDPGASLVDAVKWSLYGCVLWLAAGIGAKRGGQWGAAVVFASAAAIAIATIGHRLAGATKVFGLYTPTSDVSAYNVGPLLNPNNLAGYINLGVFCGLGLILMRQPILPRWVLGLGVATTLAAGVMAASRGGLVTLGFGLGVLAVGFWLTLRRSPTSAVAPSGRLVFGVGSAVAGGVALALLGSRKQSWLELYAENMQKLEMMSWARPMIADHTWFGIGRGAFESVFPAYRVGADNKVYSHPENFVAQWITEWGVPVGLIALFAFAWTLRPSRVGVGRHAVAAGVYAGFLAVLAQNLVDLALEIPAVVIALATCLGTCWGRARLAGVSPASESRTASFPSAEVTAWATAALTVVLVAAVGKWGWHSVGDDRRSVRASYRSLNVEDPEQRRALRDQLREAMRRHPAEPYFARIGALVAWRGRDENPIPWIDRALERAMNSGRTHYVLARILASWGAREQALLEARLATEYDPALHRRTGALAIQLTRDGDQLLRAVPDGAAGARMLQAMALTLADPKDAALRERLLTEAIVRHPALSDARTVLATDLIRELEKGAQSVRCSDARRSECERIVEEQAAEVESANRSVSGGVELRARVRMATGRPEEAERLLAEQCGRYEAKDRCLEMRVTAAARSRTRERFPDAAKAFATNGCSQGRCAEAYAYLGDLMAQRSDWLEALTYYERAVREDPSDGPWAKVAKAATRLGAHDKALHALSRMRRKGDDRAAPRQLDERRGRAPAQAVP